jgi:hypothetical protein
MVQSQPQENSLRDPILKNRSGRVAQAVREPAQQALSSNSSATQKKKKRISFPE